MSAELMGRGRELFEQGDLSLSRDYLQRTVETRKRLLGNSSPEAAEAMTELGRVLHADGDLTASRACTEPQPLG